jgi:hypothetical protein
LTNSGRYLLAIVHLLSHFRCQIDGEHVLVLFLIYLIMNPKLYLGWNGDSIKRRMHMGLDLDASSAGFLLYEKLGFLEVGLIEIDLGLFRGSGIRRHIGLRRCPKSAD